MRPIDHTHSPDLKSWITSANDSGTDFPIQNLPWCRFSTQGGKTRLGIGIGDQILDVAEVVDLFPEAAKGPLCNETLNQVMNLSVEDRIAIRHRASQLLAEGCDEIQGNPNALVAQSDATFHVPAKVRDYTDFYASVFHATNVGSMFRPDNPLLPNYKHIPIGYHGRASSLVIDGTPVRRPHGQLSPAEPGLVPERQPCKMLDYEMELGFFVGPGNQLGTTIPIADAENHIFGMCLVNDWSARDIQKWEYQPLGPFLAKSFATTVSPWVVTLEALAPFRCATFQRPDGDPQPQPYLSLDSNQQHGGVDVRLQVSLVTAKMRDEGVPGHVLSQGNFRDMYWTMAQMLTHHSSNGCNLQSGDMMASGTVSNRDKDSRGCLLELTWDGDLDNPVPGSQRTAIELATGEKRVFLQDDDEVIMTGFCEHADYRRIGFGSCRGRILPAN